MSSSSSSKGVSKIVMLEPPRPTNLCPSISANLPCMSTATPDIP